MEVKSNLKDIIDKKGLSVLRLSKDIDFRYETIRQIYNNENKSYSSELLTKICKHLNITPGELLILDKEDPGCE
jgi:putative transcriptional regulator